MRILFRNLLPTGVDGNLFIPVDTTVMGSGMGPDMDGMAEIDPQNPMCGDDPAQDRRLLHREPRHPAPARRHHPLDQRRHAAPVDHPGRREHRLSRRASAWCHVPDMPRSAATGGA